jgi:formyltetrahydrofolate-dependent phosphoribosylglycinamide formyltransferase
MDHLLEIQKAVELRERMHLEGKKVVFTNGCFDLLHVGHVRYLEQARALGDALIVGVNGDVSVRELKGPTRPIHAESARAEVLRALRSVDATVIFDEMRATRLIEMIRPHVYAKGGDYTVDSLNIEEREALQKAGTEIKILSLVEGQSTTQTLNRMMEVTSGKRKLRVGFAGSTAGTHLAAVMEKLVKIEQGFEVVLAVTDRGQSGFAEIARGYDVPLQVLSCNERGWLTENGQKEWVEHLQRARVDILCLTGMMQLVKEPVLSAYAGKIVNVHPSLLPEYKGKDAVQQALAAGKKMTGATLHWVNSEVDGGEVISQREVAVVTGDDVESLHSRIKTEEIELLWEFLTGLTKGV